MATLSRFAVLIQFALASVASSATPAHSGPWNFQVSWQTNPCEKAGLSRATLRAVEAMPGGGLVAACKDPDPGEAPTYVVRIDEGRNVLWVRALGGSRGSDVFALRAGAAGDVYVAGATYSSDFPIVNGLLKQFASGRERMGFIGQLDEKGDIIASTFLGGAGDTVVQALGIDSKGDVFAGGSTTATDFPTSGDAFIPRITPGSSLFRPRYAYLFRFSPALDRMLYSTLLGGSGARCSSGSSCLSAIASTAIFDIAIDEQDNAVVAGTTTATNFPIQSGFTFTGGGSSDAIVAKFAAQGTSLVWSTLLGGGAPFVLLGGDAANAVEIESDGSIVLGGFTNSDTFPVSEDAYRQPDPLTDSMARRGFITRLDPSSRMLYSTTTESEVLSMSLDPDGGIWFSGGNNLARLTPSRDTLDYEQALGETGSRFVRPEGFLLWSGASILTSLDFAEQQTPQVLTVSPRPIATGDLLAITGIQIGPPVALNADVGSDGMLADQIEAVRVFFNGISARMIGASAGRIELIVPIEIADFGETLIDVVHEYSIVASLVVRVERPAVRDLGVVRADGIPTTREPVKPGETILAFVWDSGVLDPGCKAGEVARTASPLPLTVTASVDDKPARVAYAGTVPGFLCGLKQINVEVPPVPPGSNELELNLGSTIIRTPVVVDLL